MAFRILVRQYTLQTMALICNDDTLYAVMKTLTDKTKQMNVLFGVLALIVVVTIAPHAFAITFTAADDPHGPMQANAWSAALVVVGIMSGVGVWTTIKRGTH
ncbi:MAG: hypothetical protein KGI10_02275 [Thaumarchaeota archaeon]|nr:hypothetical protein [Nitrososphaerota archaeon]